MNIIVMSRDMLCTFIMRYILICNCNLISYLISLSFVIYQKFRIETFLLFLKKTIDHRYNWYTYSTTNFNAPRKMVRTTISQLEFQLNNFNHTE